MKKEWSIKILYRIPIKRRVTGTNVAYQSTGARTVNEKQSVTGKAKNFVRKSVNKSKTIWSRLDRVRPDRPSVGCRIAAIKHQ